MVAHSSGCRWQLMQSAREPVRDHGFTQQSRSRRIYYRVSKFLNESKFTFYTEIWTNYFVNWIA